MPEAGDPARGLWDPSSLATNNCPYPIIVRSVICRSWCPGSISKIRQFIQIGNLPRWFAPRAVTQIVLRTSVERADAR